MLYLGKEISGPVVVDAAVSTKLETARFPCSTL
jgi:hypothetical protein